MKPNQIKKEVMEGLPFFPHSREDIETTIDLTLEEVEKIPNKVWKSYREERKKCISKKVNEKFEKGILYALLKVSEELKKKVQE